MRVASSDDNPGAARPSGEIAVVDDVVEAEFRDQESSHALASAELDPDRPGVRCDIDPKPDERAAPALELDELRNLHQEIRPARETQREAVGDGLDVLDGLPQIRREPCAP